MSVPGSNLLRQALKLIRPQVVRWYANTGQATNAVGYVVPSFAAGVEVQVASVQAVPLNRYQSMGLDFKRRYVSAFIAADVIGLERERAPDEFEWSGRRFSVVTDVPWYAVDGWVEVVGVDTGPATGGV